MVGLTLANIAVKLFRSHAIGWPRGVIAAVDIAIFVAYAVTAVWLSERHGYAPLVRLAARQHGYDVCLKCGYWLRGLGETIERCPECGTIREPNPGG